MLKKLARLIDVKSIVTLLLAATFVYLSVTSKVTAEQFLTVWTVVISFYFGTQVGKKEKEDEQKEDIDVKQS